MAQTKVKRIGKYEVVDVVGRGGMGVVYKAQDNAIGRTVAIKMMTGAFADDPDLLSRFYREARSTGNLQHPNIVTVHDLGDEEGNPYLVMEFLEGESLEKVIAARRPVPLIEKISLMMQVCNGLHYAHQRTVVHRDIKPANVVILKDGTIKIVDFGIARMGNEGLTRPGQVVGSIQYMSPEQINAGQVDARTDIFSAGVVLYQLLTYELPFEGKDTGSTLLKILNEPPRPIRDLLPDCPPELEEISQRALAKEPEQRYQTAEEMGFELLRVHEKVKQETIAESLVKVVELIKAEEWNRAKDVLQNVLKLDRQHLRANELYREVQQAIQKQARSAQAKQLRTLAEEALKENKLEEALSHLETATSLDQADTEIRNLHKQLKEAKERSQRVEQMLKRAESAHYGGDVEEARQAVEEALAIQPDNEEARALKSQIEESSRLKQLQRLMDDARKQIASRKFTAALEILNQAVTIGATHTSLQELIAVASAGREQEKRRRELEKIGGEVQDALDKDDYKTACARVEQGLERFPNDTGLLKLKNLAEKQREAGERRGYIEGTIAQARKLMDSGKAGQALELLNAASQRYPGDPNLQSLLTTVAETLAREEETRRKNSLVQAAKEQIRNKKYDEAIRILEEARSDFGPAEFEVLLQYARDEKAAHLRRQRIEQAEERAQKLAAEEEFDRAVEVLEAALKEMPDEELNIILSEVRRSAAEFASRVRECMETAQRLLGNQKAPEAVKFLESQPRNFSRVPEFAAVLESARQQQERLRIAAKAQEAARAALAKSDFAAAEALLRQGLEAVPKDNRLAALQSELTSKRSQAAKAALEKALKDGRMMVLVRSYDSAVGILSKAAEWAPYAPENLRSEYEALRQDVNNALAAVRTTPPPRPAERKEDSGTVAGGWDEAMPVVAAPESPSPSPRDHDLSELSQLAAQAQTCVGLPELTAVFERAASISKRYPGDKALQPMVDSITQRLRVVGEQPGAETKAAPTAVPKPAGPGEKRPEAGVAGKPKGPAKIIEEERKAVPVGPPKAAPPPQPKPAAKVEAKAAAPPPPAAAAPAPPVEPPAVRPAEKAPAKPTVVPAATPQVTTPSAVKVPPSEPKPAIAPPVKEAPSPAAVPRLPTPVAAADTEAPARGINPKLIAGIAAAVVVAVIIAVAALRKGPSQTASQSVAPGTSAVKTVEPTAAPVPAPPTAATTAPSATSSPAAEEQPKETAPPPPSKAAIAKLQIKGSAPDVEVRIDGQAAGKVGRNGRLALEVAAGEHSIELRRDGFEPKSVQRRFAAGQNLILGGNDVRLAPLPPARSTAAATPPKPSPSAPAVQPTAPAVNAAQQEWDRLSNSRDVGALEDFRRRNPGPLAEQAARRLDDVEWEAARGSKEAAKLQAFLNKHPNSPNASAARAELTSLNERGAVLELLRRYEAGYERKDVGQIAAVWPNLGKDERRKLGDFFKFAKAVKVDLRPVRGPEFSGDSASMSCIRTIEYVADGKPQKFVNTINLRLKKSNGSWVLESLESSN